MRKTKMVCTIGPASEKREILKQIIESGMNVSRHNFSHGDHEEHGGRIRLVQELRKELNKPIAIILDTKGPEIRTGNFEKGKVELIGGNDFTVICGEDILGDETKCTMSYANLHKDVTPGNVILIADGIIGLRVESVEGNKIHCKVTNTGVIGNHKNVNVPGVSIKLPAITDKDIADLVFGCEIGVDAIAASFIRKASDVLEIRKVLDSNGGADIQIFSKIENQEGVDNIDEIIKFSDGVMVARGDLGVEIPTEEVPLVQKMIIEKCNAAGKPVITATQMLDSMIRYPRPTRAEASDVANAIFDGTDAIMLSGESANGDFPVEAVSTMARIAARTEQSLNYEANIKKKRKNHIPNVPNAISLAACNTAIDLNASAIIAITQSGRTPQILSKYRPECPIIAITPNEKIARRLALNWGVFPIIDKQAGSTDEVFERAEKLALESGYVKKGDLVVITAGIPSSLSGSTNMVKVHLIGDVLVQGKGMGEVMGYGTAHVVDNAQEAADNVEVGNILVVKEFDKSYTAVLDKVAGVITEDDGVKDNMAIECISRGIPVILKAADAYEIIKTGSFITMDVRRGIVYSGKANII